jgi:hypothetical protein
MAKLIRFLSRVEVESQLGVCRKREPLQHKIVGRGSEVRRWLFLDRVHPHYVPTLSKCAGAKGLMSKCHPKPAVPFSSKVRLEFTPDLNNAPPAPL